MGLLSKTLEKQTSYPNMETLGRYQTVYSGIIGADSQPQTNRGMTALRNGEKTVGHLVRTNRVGSSTRNEVISANRTLARAISEIFGKRCEMLARIIVFPTMLLEIHLIHDGKSNA